MNRNIATLTRISNPSSPTTCSIASSFKGTSISLKTNHLNQSQKSELETRTQALWDKALAYIQRRDPEASQMRVNLSQLFLSYKDPSGKTHFVDLGYKTKEEAKTHPNPDYSDVSSHMDKLRHCISNIYDLILWPSSENHPSSRCLGGSSPLALPSETSLRNPILKLRRITADDFLKMSQLDKHPSSLSIVKNGETLLLGSRNKVKEAIAKQQEKIKILQRKEPQSQKDKQDLIAEQNLLKNWEKIGQKIGKKEEEEGIDTFSLYAALGFQPLAPVGSSLIETANFITQKALPLAFRELHPIKEGESQGAIKSRLLGMRPKETEVNVYAEEIGDLCLHERIDYMQRISESNQDRSRPSRIAKGNSLEEWIVYQTLHPTATMEKELFERLFCIPFQERYADIFR